MSASDDTIQHLSGAGTESARPSGSPYSLRKFAYERLQKLCADRDRVVRCYPPEPANQAEQLRNIDAEMKQWRDELALPDTDEILRAELSSRDKTVELVRKVVIGHASASTGTADMLLNLMKSHDSLLAALSLGSRDVRPASSQQQH